MNKRTRKKLKRLKSFLKRFNSHAKPESRYSKKQKERVSMMIHGGKHPKRKKSNRQKTVTGINPVNHITTKSSIWTVKKK